MKKLTEWLIKSSFMELAIDPQLFNKEMAKEYKFA